MFKPNERRLGRCATAFAGLLLTAGHPSSATVTASAALAEPGAARAGEGYQLRCWQEGRLLFEDSPVTLPSSLGPMRLVAVDRAGRPIYLFESAQATCQLRHRDDKERR